MNMLIKCHFCPQSSPDNKCCHTNHSELQRESCREAIKNMKTMLEIFSNGKRSK